MFRQIFPDWDIIAMFPGRASRFTIMPKGNRSLLLLMYPAQFTPMTAMSRRCAVSRSSRSDSRSPVSP